LADGLSCVPRYWKRAPAKHVITLNIACREITITWQKTDDVKKGIDRLQIYVNAL